jgi:prepilin-type N-terminal cleavage/methylation domain-containing protein
LNNKFNKKNKGFTLLEALIAMAILSFMVVSTLAIFTASVRTGKISKDSVNTKYTAEQYLELVKSIPFDDSLVQLTVSLAQEGINLVTGSENVYANGDRSVVIEINEADEDFFPNAVNPITPFINEEESVFFDNNDNPLLGTDINIDETTYPGLSTDNIRLKYIFNSTPRVVNITNISNRHIEIYCINTPPADRTPLPFFNILEGSVSIYDITTPDTKLMGENDTLFASGADEVQFTRCYEIKVTVRDPSGAHTGTGGYQIIGTKTIYDESI